MANVKRQEFLNRLLRISELNEELVQVCDRSMKQPAFTKKIELVKMNQFNLKLHQQRKHQEDIRHGSKILIINHVASQMRQYKSTRNMPIQQMPKNPAQSITLETSASCNPRRLSQNHNKLIIEKKKILLKQQQNKQKIRNYVNAISKQIKNSSEIKESITSKRFIQKKESLIVRNGLRQQNRQPSLIKYQQNVINKFINPEKEQDDKKQLNGLSNDSQIQMSINRFSKQQLSQHLNHYLNPNIAKNYQRKEKYFKSMNHISYLSQQKNLQEEKKNKLIFIKEINKNYGKPFHPPPRITAKSYIIAEIKQSEDNIKVIVSFNSKNSQQVASLTKIMTCIVIIEFCEKYGIQMDKELIKIGKYESSIGGTSAQIKPGQIYTVIQLLHGLMLPSGNDASLGLAVWCGRKLLYLDKQDRLMMNYRYESPINQKITAYSISCESTMDGDKFLKGECYARFIKEMNEKRKALKLTKTHYSNSHGLINLHNRSTAYDIAVLSRHAMKNKVFKDIVSCKFYECVIKYVENEQIREIAEKDYTQLNQHGDSYQETIELNQNQTQIIRPTRPATAVALSRPGSACPFRTKDLKYIAVEKQMTVSWKNTHKLLQNKSEEYLGIKTGFTNNAGPCLSSCLSIQGRIFIIVVLSCGKMSLRFKQTEILKKWLCKQENIGKSLKKGSNNKLQGQFKALQNEQDNENDEYLDEQGKLE